MTIPSSGMIIMISGMIINTLNTIEAKQIKLVQNFAKLCPKLHMGMIIMISGMIINTLNTIEAKQIKLVQNFARWKQRERSL